MSTTYRGGLSIDEVKSQVQADKVYKMGSNENPLGPSPQVVEAIQQVAVNLGEYPPFVDDKLKQALVDKLGQGLTLDHIVTGNGGCDIIELLSRAYLDKGSECIICPPAFPVYKVMADKQEATIVNIALQRPDFSYDIDGILAAVTDKTRVLYLCTPNNPTGSTLKADEVAQLVGNLPPEVLIVYDEVYYHFDTNQENRPDPFSYVLEGKNFLILHSFSKAYGMAGLRLGYGIAPPEVVARVANYRRPYHLNRFAFEGGLAALADQAHIDKTVALTVEGREWLYGHIQELGLKVWPSQGNFLLVEAPGSPQELTAQLIERGVIVRPAFGLDDCIRVSIGTPAGNQAFIAALTEIVEA